MTSIFIYFFTQESSSPVASGCTCLFPRSLFAVLISGIGESPEGLQDLPSTAGLRLPTRHTAARPPKDSAYHTVAIRNGGKRLLPVAMGYGACAEPPLAARWSLGRMRFAASLRAVPKTFCGRAERKMSSFTPLVGLAGWVARVCRASGFPGAHGWRRQPQKEIR